VTGTPELLADVIFPAPSAAYVVGFFLPIAVVLAMAAEIVVYLWLERQSTGVAKLPGVVILINIFSWVAGMLLSFCLPTFLVPQMVGTGQNAFWTLGPGPHWNMVAGLSFVWACALSIVLEYVALRLFRKRLGLRKPAVCSAIANILGYAVIGLVIWVRVRFGGPL
jgi:hypothetical protein